MIEQASTRPQPSAIDTLTAAIGPSIGIHVSECPDGGYLIMIDGAIRSAKTDGWEVVEALRQAMASRYSKPFTRPEPGDLADEGDARDDPLPEEDCPRVVRPPLLQEHPLCMEPGTLAGLIAGFSVVVGV